ncbi:MAG: Cna B-type domain-containing protein [Clostridia bacterium]|nr:Cna B-type domain-containing protein [Clostridia bacterium]
MTAKRLIILLTLTLCALLVCSCAMAEIYSVNIENFDRGVMPYCAETELAIAGGSEINSSSIGAPVNGDVTIRIVPAANCGVDAIGYRYTDNGATLRENCTLRTDASGAVTASFRMPPADVVVTITMSREGAAAYAVEGSFLHCTGTISDGEQTGIGPLDAAPGSTLTVTAVPEDGYTIDSMRYTTFGDPLPRDIPFSTDESGAVTGTLTMPEDKVYISVNGSIHYLSYDASGAALGEQSCTEWSPVTNSSAKWYDLSSANDSWYVVRGSVSLSKDTTLRVTGDVHLILCDGAKLTAGDGVYIKKGSSLSIYGQSKGTGKLIAKPESGPGIGGMADTVGGSLYIHGGVIEATGGTNAAGIGGGNHNSGYQNIVIYGGKVTAKGGSSGAGIGKGQQNSPDDCGPIVIYGGEVTASSTKYGAGIGGGEDRDGGTIRIYGGTVKATGGHDGAGIGGGEGGSGGDIAIQGGTVTATGGAQGAGIGGGEKGSGGTITIRGGTVKAYGSFEADPKKDNSFFGDVDVSGGAAIGGGLYGNAGTITIEGGTVTADACEPLKGGAGIGGGYGRAGGTILISGGTITAKGYNGAGIGGGAEANCSASITITGGVIREAYGVVSAGIGAGYAGDFNGTIAISGGQVNASSAKGGAGIGAGLEKDTANDDMNGGDCRGTIEITGGTVTARANENGLQGQAIGHGGKADEEGTLRLGDQMRVSSGSNSSGSGAAFQNVEKRVGGCRSRYARIDVCAEHIGCSYEVTHETHTAICQYCLTRLSPEAHDFGEDGGSGHCIACGYSNAFVTVTYQPGHDDATGEMAAVQYVPDSVHPAANCAYVLDGFVFGGWQVGDSDVILAEGEAYQFTDSSTLTAIWRNYWPELQAAINQAASGAVITMTGKATASAYDGALTIPSGKTITLDLNGYTLNRGLTSAKGDGQVITNNGTLTIRDSRGGGIITGGYTSSDGGAIVNKGTLTLEGGTITGNRSNWRGGAVFNDQTMIMSGGVITGNTSGMYGGGVWNWKQMTMTGGEISGNFGGTDGGGISNSNTLSISGGTITGNRSTSPGAGVSSDGRSGLRLSGAPVITGNTRTSGAVSNVYIEPGQTSFTVNLDPASAGNARTIGISSSAAPTVDGPVGIVSGVTGALPQLFSDHSDYAIEYHSEDGKLYLAIAQDYMVTVSEGMDNGTVTADRASCHAGDTVTLTVTPAADHILASLIVTPEGGEAMRILPDGETGAYCFTMPAANVAVDAGFIPDKTSAAVQIVWDDDGNADGRRPEAVNVTLLDLGEPVCAVELTAAAGWADTRTDLSTNHNGEVASYSWTIHDSDLPAGYSLTGSTHADGQSTLTLSSAESIEIQETGDGTVSVSKRAAALGETITVTAAPEEGWLLGSLTCTVEGGALSLTGNGETGEYTFTMPAAAVTVTAVFENKTHWMKLQELMDGASAGGTITLTRDYRGVEGDVPLKVLSGQRVTINLNGHTIDAGESGARVFTVGGGELTITGSGTVTGGLAENTVGGAFIVQSGGLLTLNGGVITGNAAGNGGGAVAVTTGTLVMNGGRISENDTDGNGGGVRVEGGTFVMNGGEICVNGAVGKGGGLWVGAGSTVHITGGSLWSNDADLGQDVYLNAVGMAVSGHPDIMEVYAANTLVTVDGALDPGARIGLTCSNSAAKQGAVLTSGLAGHGALDNFTSAKYGYAVTLNADGEVVLATARTVTLDPNDGSSEARLIRVADGTALAEPERPERKGFLFLGWQLEGADYDFETPVTADITLTAAWQEIPPFGTPDFTLPGGVAAIEDSAFEGAAMTVVSIPVGCGSIGNAAFRDCVHLTQIRIPAACTLGKDVFSGCGTVYVYGTAGSPAENYCAAHDNCVFVAE